MGSSLKITVETHPNSLALNKDADRVAAAGRMFLRGNNI